ncbi:MAG: hypothetical protein NXY57DRAFT_209851 [Lentinula lateritia]|nr:MAG: hypothetical protein NXY57DRAFT_209851 [Lentinula lateritia]
MCDYRQNSYFLSHLLSVSESVWTRALLSRTRLTDPIFQEDLLAFISVMTTSLRTGLPSTGSHGLNVIQKEARKKEAEEYYRDIYPE